MIRRVAKDFKRNKWLYVLAIPIVAYYVLFQYLPMFGAVIAFKDYSPIQGIWGSEWVGLEHFRSFIDSHYFWRLFRNTVLLSLYSLVFDFTAPIVLALLIHEVRSRYVKSFVQTVSFMPYFISLIVVCGLVKDLTQSGGIANLAFTFLTGGDGHDLLQQPGLFRGIYVMSEIWQRVGWESIIYAAALSTIPQAQYEAARIDGASRLRQIRSITLPGLLPTITIMFILRIGHLMDVGYEKILLLYNPVIYESADVISTFVYRKGLLDNDWSFSSAIGLFNSAINLLMLVIANALTRKTNQNSLW
ncbi:putative aldouronate transport system permease protein [Paenibacillus sp. cl141a]|uniref:ABC transporter permease n=1 Tax=Paenibacillus sp. cl141a TaxID=1761877 RepID=UPI0008B5310B|nr:ABC transporter permease subunit [Paenibacillus sp. cl141a]SEL92863.1 putative aldouronate transport system permease protein [Paenibacillus sp. cl141a]